MRKRNGMRPLIALIAATAIASGGMAQAPGPALPEKQAIAVFGQTIRYVEVGTGPTIVLIHGTGQSVAAWSKQIPELSRRHHVIAIDLLGFGDSDKPQIGYTIQTWVDMLGEFLRKKQVANYTIAGLSLGGWIAAQYTLQSLDPANRGEWAVPAPSRLVLTDAGGIRPITPAPADGPINVTSIAAARAGLRAAYHDPAYASAESAGRAFAAKMTAGNGVALESSAHNLRLSGEYIDDKLARITIPTLIIWGDDDHIVPLSSGRAFAAGIPGSKLVIITECGHVVPTEKPAEFLKALEDFLG